MNRGNARDSSRVSASTGLLTCTWRMEGWREVEADRLKHSASSLSLWHAQQHHCLARGQLTANGPVPLLNFPRFSRVFPPPFPLLPLLCSVCFLAVAASQRWLVRGSRKGKAWRHWRGRARPWRRSWKRSGASSTTPSVSIHEWIRLTNKTAITSVSRIFAEKPRSLLKTWLKAWQLVFNI